MEKLKLIASFFKDSRKEVPLLIPGVGVQGGSAEEVVSVLKKVDYDLRIVRINLSNGLNYAYEKTEEGFEELFECFEKIKFGNMGIYLN